MHESLKSPNPIVALQDEFIATLRKRVPDIGYDGMTITYNDIAFPTPMLFLSGSIHDAAMASVMPRPLCELMTTLLDGGFRYEQLYAIRTANIFEELALRNLWRCAAYFNRPVNGGGGCNSCRACYENMNHLAMIAEKPPERRLWSSIEDVEKFRRIFNERRKWLSFICPEQCEFAFYSDWRKHIEDIRPRYYECGLKLLPESLVDEVENAAKTVIKRLKKSLESEFTGEAVTWVDYNVLLGCTAIHAEEILYGGETGEVVDVLVFDDGTMVELQEVCKEECVEHCVADECWKECWESWCWLEAREPSMSAKLVALTAFGAMTRFIPTARKYLKYVGRIILALAR